MAAQQPQQANDKIASEDIIARKVSSGAGKLGESTDL